MTNFKGFLADYFDDMIFYGIKCFVLIFSFSQILISYFAQYGLDINNLYFGIFGRSMYWAYRFTQEREKKKKGLPFETEDYLSDFIALFLGSTTAFFFVGMIHTKILPNYDLWFLALLIGAFWKYIWEALDGFILKKIKKVFDILTTKDDESKTN